MMQLEAKLYKKLKRSPLIKANTLSFTLMFACRKVDRKYGFKYGTLKTLKK